MKCILFMYPNVTNLKEILDVKSYYYYVYFSLQRFMKNASNVNVICSEEILNHLK